MSGACDEGLAEDLLIEELARRLCHATYANPAHPDAKYDHDWKMYVDAARETLRQMAWTLKTAAEVTRQIGPEAKEIPPVFWEQWAHILETGPLTLAPPDFKP